MFTPTNFSDRLKKAMSGFQKAHDDLTSLLTDVEAETKQTEQHLQKLKLSAGEIENHIGNLAPFVSTKK